MKKRKTNRAKRVSSLCKNNNECPHCRGNRTHSSKRRSLFDEVMEGFEQLKEDRNEGHKD